MAIALNQYWPVRTVGDMAESAEMLPGRNLPMPLSNEIDRFWERPEIEARKRLTLGEPLR